MTMRQSAAKVKGEPEVFALPDITDEEKAAMTSFKHLAFTGIVRDLFQHFGQPENAVFMGERYLVERPNLPASARRIPDLLIAFNADVALMERQNGYVISEQGKPPDFILEVGSPSTEGRMFVESGSFTPDSWSNTVGSTKRIRPTGQAGLSG